MPVGQTDKYFISLYYQLIKIKTFCQRLQKKKHLVKSAWGEDDLSGLCWFSIGWQQIVAGCFRLRESSFERARTR